MQQVEAVHSDASGGSEAAGAGDAGVVHHVGVHGHGAANVHVPSASRHEHGCKRSGAPGLKGSPGVPGAGVHRHGVGAHSALRSLRRPLRASRHGERARLLVAAAPGRGPRAYRRGHGGGRARGDATAAGGQNLWPGGQRVARPYVCVLARPPIQHHGHRPGKTPLLLSSSPPHNHSYHQLISQC